MLKTYEKKTIFTEHYFFHFQISTASLQIAIQAAVDEKKE
jgi:hypothetical protein